MSPSSEQLQQWATEYWGNPGELIGEGEKYIAIAAYRAGADQELEACYQWLNTRGPGMAVLLRAARRPKLPSLKEQALETLSRISKDEYPCSYQDDKDWETIRRALEQLDD